MSRRASTAMAMTLVLFAWAACVPAEEQPLESGNVLFVCEHGSVKSLLAKLLFERAAAREGLTLRAVSRGTAPDAAVPGWMRAALERDGFDIGAWQPVALSPSDLRSARRIVTFDVPLASHGVVSPATEHWDGLPSVSRDYGMGREAIAARVEELVHELKQSSVSLGEQRVNRQ